MSRIRVLKDGFAVRDLANRKISIREPLSVIKVGKVISLINEKYELRLSRQEDGKIIYAFYYRRQVLAYGIVVWMPRIPFIKKLLES